MFPLDYIGITGYYRPDHLAIDMAHHNKDGDPVYSALAGEVMFMGTFNDAGNMIVISSSNGDKMILTRYLHLKNLPKYKIGDKVSQGEQIAISGATGEAKGVHLHFEYWICPSDYKYRFEDQSKYAVDPLKYCYVYPNQTVNADDKDKVMYLGDQTYIVVKGDTLTKIAKKYNTTYQILASYNNISNPDLIYVGQIIKIPSSNKIYTVVKGDTLTKIAKQFNTTVDKLYQDNILTIGNNPDLIYPGQQLIIQ